MLHAPTLGELLDLAATTDPSAPAFRYRDETLTYAEWRRLSQRVADRMHAAGVRRGDVVALLLPSTPFYLVCYLAAARLGAITTGLNVRYRRHEIGHLLRHSGARLLLAVESWHGADFRAALNSLDEPLPELDSIAWFAAEELQRSTLATVERWVDNVVAAPSVAVQSQDLLTIVFTSGTTGVPKGACYTHANVLALAEIETRRHAGGAVPFRKHLAAGLSFAHIGTMARIAVQIGHQAVSFVQDSFDPARVLQLIEQERLVHLGGIPTQLIMLLEHADRPRRDLSSLRSLLVGGAPSSPDLLRRLAEAFGATISVRYSSTEVGIATASSPDDPPEILASTVGKPTLGVELRIVDADNRPLPPGEEGEVVVRSPATMRGYWRAAEATARTLDAEGWIHTGDIGLLDAAGYLRLRGRRSEMYIRGGYNVYPEEVENVLAKHLKVARIGILGVADPKYGEIGWAFVVPRSIESLPDLAELRAFVGEELASFKRPDGLTLLQELPLTPMFKVDKQALRRLVGTEYGLHGGDGLRGRSATGP